MTGTVALVESPAQLLNVIEWAYANRRLPSVSIMVLPPAQPAARLQLLRMTDLARESGCAVSWYEVRCGGGAGLRALRSIVTRVCGASTMIIGDPFSGVLQVIIGVARPERLVVVDDGSATLRFAEIMDTGGELVRWHRTGGGSVIARSVAARAKRRMLCGPTELFTAMPVHTRSMPVRHNDLGWTRQRFAAPALLPGADLVGTSLVESGVVDERTYLATVLALMDRHRITRYLAHRRESTEKLIKIADIGLQVIRPDVPLEIFARTSGVAERMISFPSTVLHTLPPALSDTRFELSVCRIGSDDFLELITGTTRLDHVTP